MHYIAYIIHNKATENNYNGVCPCINSSSSVISESISFLSIYSYPSVLLLHSKVIK